MARTNILDNRRGYVIVACLAIIVLIAIIVYSLRGSSSNHKDSDNQCQLMSDVPKSINQKAHTEELDVLIGYNNAYLEVLADSEGTKSTYMKLSLTSIKWSKYQEYVSVYFGCGRIYFFIDDKPDETIIKAELPVSCPFRTNSAELLSCKPDNEKVLSWSKEKAYHCAGELKIGCENGKEKYNIVLSELRLELGGNKDNVKKDDFTKNFDEQCSSNVASL